VGLIKGGAVKRASAFSSAAVIAAFGFVAVPASAQADCTGHITPDGFEFSCPNPNPSSPDDDGASFTIELRGQGEILSGSVTSPEGFTCEVRASGVGRLGDPYPSSIGCGSSGTVPAGQKVVGTWQLSSPDACKAGATVSTAALSDTDQGGGSLPCGTGSGSDPGTGTGSGGQGRVECVVPALKGKKIAAAKKLLKNAHCAVGKITKKTSAKSKRGKVLASKPKAGTHKPAGTKVALVVGK
jgi:hypothetical protein